MTDNGSYALHYLAAAGVAGFALANGSMSSNHSGESTIRKNPVEALAGEWP